MRATGAGTIKVAVSVSRLSQTLVPQDDRQRWPGHRDRDGRTRGGVATACGPLRIAVDVCGRRRGARADARPSDDRRLRVQARDQRRRASSASSARNALHSLSPVMHNAAFQAAGIDAVYVPLPVQDFSDFLSFAEGMGIEGVSVTIPFKLDALRAAESSDALTQQVGAANTLRRSGTGWEATNTDVEGFLQPLGIRLGTVDERRSRVRARCRWRRSCGHRRACVEGRAGDRARPARRAGTASSRRVSMSASGAYPPESGSWDLLVNCTPLGGAARRSESPMPADTLTGRLVYDLTYGPGEAPLLRDARGAGLVTLDGLAMLVAQAERQFEWWTGQKAGTGSDGGRRTSAPRGG